VRTRAVAKYVGMSPLKLSLVAREVRGKRVEEALSILEFHTSPAARAIAKVIKSAAFNAENSTNVPASEMAIVGLYIDKGPNMKRFRPQARGRVSPILKRSSHITVEVDMEE